jgi:hypothetical protein
MAEYIADLFIMTEFPELLFHSGSAIEYVVMTLDFKLKHKAEIITTKQITDDIANDPLTKRSAATPPAGANLYEAEAPQESAALNDYDLAHYALLRTHVAKSLYLAKSFRHDILLAVSFLATRAHVCTSNDLDTLHRVISYTGNADRGIAIEFGNNHRIRAYVDAAIHDKDMKSHTGVSLVLGTGGPLYVTSVKQPIVSKSSTEAKLIAASYVASEALCFRNFAVPGYLYQYNMSTISLINNGGPSSKRSRHIDISNFWIQEKIAEGSLVIEHCPTETVGKRPHQVDPGCTIHDRKSRIYQLDIHVDNDMFSRGVC